MLIDNQDDLDKALNQAIEISCCAIDVEFNRRSTYHPQVSLVQLAGDGIPTALLDILQLKNTDSLKRFLASPHTEKVFHSFSQDLEAFDVLCGVLPENSIDTQIAASFCGLGFQLGFSSLVDQCLGKTLDKRQQTSNWMRRPLSDAQLRYAAADVDDLLACYRILKDTLEANGRMEWVREECLGKFTGFTERQYKQRIDPSRIRGAGKLKPREFAIMRDLAAWREALACRRDRPSQWMVPNAAMMELAQLRPTSMESLNTVENLTDKQVAFYGNDILTIVTDVLSRPDDDIPDPPEDRPLTSQEKRVVKKISAEIGSLAEEIGIAQQMLSGSKEIRELLRIDDVDRSPLYKGWRRDLLKPRLDAILNRR